jgi:16S rRNA processing protein RimM
MPNKRVLLGIIGRPHGVHGLVRVQSFTAEPQDLARYSPLEDDKGQAIRLAWQRPGIAEISLLKAGTWQPVRDRTTAASLTHTRLYVARAALPEPEADEFYLADLIGLHAIGPEGELGTVTAVHDYGGGVSLEIGRADGRALLVPFTRSAVPEVDLTRGRIVVEPPIEVAP